MPIRISQLPVKPFSGEIIDHCFYVERPTQAVYSVPLSGIINHILDKAKEQGLTIEIKRTGETVTSISITEHG